MSIKALVFLISIFALAGVVSFSRAQDCNCVSKDFVILRGKILEVKKVSSGKRKKTGKSESSK